MRLFKTGKQSRNPNLLDGCAENSNSTKLRVMRSSQHALRQSKDAKNFGQVLNLQNSLVFATILLQTENPQTFIEHVHFLN
jgi:hypothetical protein